MSYPSINRHLENQGVSPDTASEDQMKAAFLAAFQEDLPLGMQYVSELVEKLNEIGDRAMLTLPPNSPEGKQFARLLGPDIPRQILEERFGVSFGFYNCCKGVVGTDRTTLNMNLREQMAAQHPNFVDC